MEEQEKPFAERFSEFTSKAVSVAPIIAAIGIAIWWVFFGTVQIVQLELNIAERIGLTIVTIVMALSYRKLIAIGGFEDGKKTTDYKTEFKRWRENCKANNIYKSQIDEFVKDKCYDNVRALIKKNLENNSIEYNKVFDELGHLIDLDYKNNYTKKQCKIIKKCVKMKVYVPDIFTIENSKYLGTKRRITEKEFKTKTDSINIVVTSVLAFFSTSIMFAWIGFSKGSWIYAMFQIALWTGTGVLGRIKNYNHIIKKELLYIMENNDLIEEYCGLSQERKDEYLKIVQEKENRKHIKLITMKGEN